MASTKLDHLVEDSVIITEDSSSLYLQHIQMEKASVIIALDDKESLLNIKPRDAMKILVFAHSHLSSIAAKILELVETIFQRNLDAKYIAQFYLVNTHLNENSHIEQLEWHPEWQGVWSSSPLQDQMGSASSNSQKPSLGYFDAIAYRLSNLLQNRTQVVVTHICLSSIWLTDDIFILNQSSDLFPDISESYQLSFLSESMKSASSPGLQDFASVLSSFLDHNNIKDTLYAVGPSSNEIAKSLVDQSQNAFRQTSPNSQSGAMILIDRSLDLGLPSMYSENPMDLVYECFPRSKPHSAELLMDPKYFVLDEAATEEHDPDSWLPILNWKNNPELNNLIKSLFCKSNREILELLRNFMKDFIYKNMNSIPDEFDKILQNEPKLEKLEILVKYIKSQPSIVFKYEEIVVFLIAFTNSLSHNLSIRQEVLSSEKVIIAFFCQTRETSQIFYQLNDLLVKIAKEKKAGSKANTNQSIAVRDVLLLTLHIYSILGQSAVIEPQHEIYLQKGFVQAMMASNPKANLRAVTMWIQKVFLQLSQVSRLRSTLASAEFQNLIDFESAYPYTPLLFKIANHLLNSSQNSLNPDIIHFPYRKTITKVLSGISMLMGGSGLRHPSSFPTVIIFVVGGITFQEVATLHTLYSEKGIRLIVGSNTICNRESLMQHIFKSK